MKKLTAALVLALTVGIMMSSAVSAATLKPKSAPKSTSSSEKASPKKAADKKTETGKNAKSNEKTNVVIAANDDKTMKITIPEVSAVKKEKIKVYSPGNAGNSAVTVDATIYEVENAGTVVTASKGKKSACAVAIYLYNEKSQTYELYPEPASEKIGSISLLDFGIPVLYQFAVIDPDAPTEFCMTLGTTTYVRLLPAK